MIRVHVEFSSFALLFGKTATYYQRPRSDYLALYAVTNEFLVSCEVSDSAELAMFDASYATLASPVNSADDAWLRGSLYINPAAITRTTRDGRPVVQPVTVDIGQWHNWHGVADDEALHDGPLLAVRLWWETIASVRTFRYQVLNSDHTVSAPANVGAATFKMRWSYLDPVWLAGGRLRHIDARFGDAVSMRVVAPAAALTPNGSNTGNCNVVSGLVVPAAGDGAYDVDLDASAPVPAPAVDGYYDYARPGLMIGRGTITASASPGGAAYNLYAVDVPLTEFISQDLLIGTDTLTYDPQNINASLCLAEYLFECEVHKPDPGDDVPTEIVWRVLDTRYRTT